MSGPDDPHDGPPGPHDGTPDPHDRTPDPDDEEPPPAAGAGRSVRKVVRVTGRVQGVGFRMAAARQADRLGVTGSVRNLLDGTVEAAVEGTAQDVEAMVAWLRTGPSSARVDGVDIRQEEPQGSTGFAVS